MVKKMVDFDVMSFSGGRLPVNPGPSLPYCGRWQFYRTGKKDYCQTYAERLDHPLWKAWWLELEDNNIIIIIIITQ